VGHLAVGKRGLALAAVLAGGPDAVLSHRSAAALWGIEEEPGVGGPGGIGRRDVVEITVPAKRRPRPGIVQHRSNLVPEEIATVDGIPVTSPGRTLVDLAAVVGRRRLRRAVHEAEVLGIWDPPALAGVLDRHAGRRGIAALRAVVAGAELGAAVTRSELELRFLELLVEARLPRPRTNAVVAAGGRRFEVDCAWLDRSLAVELDGHATHATRAKFERDRERDRQMSAAGWRVIRITWRQLVDDRARLVDDLRRLLDA
jgi:very-short-patch-repair endonuclease